MNAALQDAPAVRSALGAAASAELRHVGVLDLPIDRVRPSPENEQIYRPIDPADPEIKALADSIIARGIQEPLIVTEDGWIISGHRRHAAARLAGLRTVPCRVKDIRRNDDRDEFLRLLRECNRQRVKSFDEKVREEIVSCSPEEAYQALVAHRTAKASVKADRLRIVGRTRRCRITEAKGPFLDAIDAVLEEREKFWPLSDRQIHYALLNNPPLRHAAKPDSVYDNTASSYESLTELLTRARLAGLIPMEAIADETRPEICWDVAPDVQVYLREQLDGFLQGYWRDLMQSQPNHIEIVGEKNTIAPIIKPVAADYCIPTTIGRGYCSLPPRYHISERFRRSGKEKLVLLVVSDFDPDGEEIAHSLARSLRDDFGVEDIVPVKVALTAGQVKEFRLAAGGAAKRTSANYRKFVAKHGTAAYELEALRPEDLQRVLREAIDAVIDREAFNAELDQERRDAAHLSALRCAVRDSLAGHFNIGDGA